MSETPTTAEPMTMESLLGEIESSIRTVRRGDVVEGVVVQAAADEIMVDIGLKAEGIVSGRELARMDEALDMSVGEKVLVYVVNPETAEGHALLSIRRAMAERAWREIEERYHNGEILETSVIDANKGGVIVDIGLRGFVPSSQLVSLERPPNRDASEEDLLARLSELIGRELKLKIIEVDRRRNRLILSERLAEREMRAQQREQLLKELEVGQTREGVVSNLCSFGAFVDLGGADGLVHISEISWSRVEDPGEVLQVGEKVLVSVLSLDHESKKIGLSIKRTEKDPWEGIEARYPVGIEVPGIIIKIAPFGAFVRVEDGIEGLAHNSEVSLEGRDLLQEGHELTFRVLSADPQRHRMRLSPIDLEERLGHLMAQPEGEELAPSEEPEQAAAAPETEAEAETESD